MGLYLAVVNTIMTLLFNTASPPRPPGAEIDYWAYWWPHVGIFIIIIAVIGIMLILLGTFYVRERDKMQKA